MENEKGEIVDLYVATVLFFESLLSLFWRAMAELGLPSAAWTIFEIANCTLRSMHISAPIRYIVS